MASVEARASTTDDWTFSEPDGSSTVTSSAGHVGTLETNNDANGVVVSGGQLVFDGNGRVVVPNDSAMNPGTAPFSVSVTFTTSVVPNSSVGDYDMVRKGLTTDSKSYFKVELVPNLVHTKAFAFCKVRGHLAGTGYTAAQMRNSVNLADGQPHTVACAKSDTSVSLSVDGKVVKTVTKSIYSLTNGADLSFGAKASVWEDGFTGSMDEVVYAIG